MDTTKYISFNGKKYTLVLERLREICLTSSSVGGTEELEISQVYERDGESDEMIASSRIEHETKVSGNPQNDMIIYDIVKLLLSSILECKTPMDSYTWDLGTALAINTLINWGALIEIE